MSDLFQQLTDEIQRKKAEVAKAQAELAELNTALRVFHRIRGDEVEDQVVDDVPEPTQTEYPRREGFSSLISQPHAEQDLSDSTILDACVTILREHAGKGRPNVHYKEIASEARRRGYRGRSDKAAEQSFWAIMNRKPDTFKAMGQGLYTLAERFKRTESADENG